MATNKKSPLLVSYRKSITCIRQHEVAEAVKKHMCKLYNDSASTSARQSPDGARSEDILEDKEDALNLRQFVDYLQDLSGDLKLFILRLLPHRSALDVIRDIRRGSRSKVDKISKIGKAFLKEKHPSWTKVYIALKEAKCNDKAETIKVCFL